MPKVFGIEHIIYLLTFIIISIVSLMIIIKKLKPLDEARREKYLIYIVKSVGVLLLFSLIANRISLAVFDNKWIKLIPDSFCGLSSFLFSLAIIFGKKDNNVLHCVAYIGVVGGLITIIYPDFISQASTIFHSRTITGLLHHTIMVYLFILIIITKYFVPTYKKWPNLIIGCMAYIIFGLFLNQVFGLTGAMYIGKPILEGTPLYWYLIGPIFLVIYSAFITIWELLKNKKHKL